MAMMKIVCHGFLAFHGLLWRRPWIFHMLVGLLMTLTIGDVLGMPRVLSEDQFIPSPIVEIGFPPNEYLHPTTDIAIEVTLRRELLQTLNDDKKFHVCIGLTTIAIPEDVVVDEQPPTERCYEAFDVPEAAYDVTGLLPGVVYSVSVGLVHGNQVVGLSLRSFQVASITGFIDHKQFVRLSVAEAMAMGRQYHLQNDRQNAIAFYSKVLEMFPRHAKALHRLGQTHYQEGRTSEATELIHQALQIDPNDASAHVSLALCHKSMERIDDAIREFRHALELRPSYVYAALNLGYLLEAKSKWDEALHEFRKVVSTANEQPSEPQILEPSHERMVMDAFAHVCEILRLSDGIYDAERCLAQATKQFPDEVLFHIDRGHLLLYGGQFEAAQREYETASQLGSVHAMTHAADVLEAMGDYEGSIRRYQEVLERPDSWATTVHNQIAIMMTTVLPRILPGSQDAIDQERQRFHDNVNSILRQLEKIMNPVLIDPSRIAFSTGVNMNSHHRNNRELKLMLGKMYYGLWIELGVVREEYVNSYGISPIPYHQQFQHDPPMPPSRLRVGFVSRFFYNPAVGLFMNELLPELNASKYEVYAFGIGLSKSVKFYNQVPQIAEHVVALPRDLHMAREEIRAHQVDILIYPELGMDKTTYFVAYHRLAPVQAAWWGNPDTTGVPTIDYYITSEHEHRDGHEHYTETVYQMKGMGIYHTLPPLPNSTITRDDIRRTVQERFNLVHDFHFYLSIESILHLHPDFDEAIRLILNRDPLAHIFLLASSNRRSWKHQLLRRIESHLGPEFAGRVLFFTDVDSRQELLLLGAADAVLASLHLIRPKAAMQAFTAGVPVVTLKGKLWATRITAGFYKQMGIRGLTATTLDEYADLAVRLATDEQFRDRMIRKIRRNRDRLSQDLTAVAEWEKFFDVAAARLRGERNGGMGEAIEPPLSGPIAEVDPYEEAPAAMVEGTMTCPATSLLHLL